MPEVSATKTYRIVEAEFGGAYPNVNNMPDADIPEVALIGRSNAGKSSLINALCQRKKLARVSKTPGRTQALQIYPVRILMETVLDGDREHTKEERFLNLVDLPGFGFAQVSKAEREHWHGLISDYLMNRQQLSLVMLLMDCRRDPGEDEIDLVELGRGERLLLVLTKMDKLTRNELGKRRKNIVAHLELDPTAVMAVSTYPKQEGISELLTRICAAMN